MSYPGRLLRALALTSLLLPLSASGLTRGGPRPLDQAVVRAALAAALETAPAAEASAGAGEALPHLVPSDAEVLGALLGDVGRLGVGSPLRRRVESAVGPALGAELFCPACPPPPAVHPFRGGEGLDGLDLRVARRMFGIPVDVNDEVRELVDYFSGPARRHFDRWRARAERFMPLMEPILEGYGLPRELVYVSMIESGFSTHAYSSAAAVGPWQFIASTARIYRLRMDSWVDERRDPVKATHAAARYLKWLYEEFGDWRLAWAGYNGGPGRVRRAMNAAGTEDYWTLCREDRLPSETCRYVPKIMAAALVHRFPEAFGFDAVADPEPAFGFDEVEIDRPTSLKDIAQVAGVGFDDVKMLNPELRRWVTPPPERGRGGYVLRLPEGQGDAFEAGRHALKPDLGEFFDQVRVRPGDTLWSLSRRYGCSVDDLRSLNRIGNARSLRVGMELLVPLEDGRRPAAPSGGEARTASAKPRPGDLYVVRGGDTLWSIAQRHGVTTEAVCSLNGLPHGTHVALRVGQRLRLPASASSSGGREVHVLQAGETLWQLSRRYGCGVDELKRWNGISDVTDLRPGTRLIVAP